MDCLFLRCGVSLVFIISYDFMDNDTRIKFYLNNPSVEVEVFKCVPIYIFASVIL